MDTFSVLLKRTEDNWFLMSELVKKGIRLRYRGSYLGILWSLIEPILKRLGFSLYDIEYVKEGSDPDNPL